MRQRTEWANSPGFPFSQVIYSRPITSRLHGMPQHIRQGGFGSFVEPEEFDHNQMILGVDCEKCHGAGEKHVEYQLQNPDVKPLSISLTRHLYPERKILIYVRYVMVGT